MEPHSLTPTEIAAALAFGVVAAGLLFRAVYMVVQEWRAAGVAEPEEGEELSSEMVVCPTDRLPRRRFGLHERHP